MPKFLGCLFSLVLFLFNPWVGFGLMLFFFVFFHIMDSPAMQDSPKIEAQ